MELTTHERRLGLGAVMLHMLRIDLTFPLTSLTMEAWGSSGWVIGLSGAMAPLAILLIMYAIQSVPVRIVARFIIGAGLALPWLVGDIWINTAA